MFDIDSKLWRVRSYNCAHAEIIQRATGAIRQVCLSALPSFDQLSAMHENAFNSVMRRAFHGDNQRKGI